VDRHEARATRRASRLGVDWMVARVAMSDVVPDGLATVRAYSWREIVEAHALLDAVESVRDYRRMIEEVRRG